MEIINENPTNQRRTSLLGQLAALEVGEELTVPVTRASYLRSICVSFGLQWNKRFATATNRQQLTITARRTK